MPTFIEQSRSLGNIAGHFLFNGSSQHLLMHPLEESLSTHHKEHSIPNCFRELDQALKNHYSKASWRAFQNDLEILLNNQFISKHAAAFTICSNTNF